MEHTCAFRRTVLGATPDARTERSAARDNMMSPAVQLSLEEEESPVGDQVVNECLGVEENGVLLHCKSSQERQEL